MLRTVGGIVGALALVVAGRMIAAPVAPPPPRVVPETTTVAALPSPPMPSAPEGIPTAMPAPAGAQPGRGG